MGNMAHMAHVALAARRFPSTVTKNHRGTAKGFRVAFIRPMLAIEGKPPTGAGWAFEFKWDGYRAIAEVDGGQLRLFSRAGNNITAYYPEIAILTELAGGHQIVLDGELVALDADGTPRLARIQRRHQAIPRQDLLAAFPVSYYAFDVLVLDGEQAYRQPYQSRRETLEGLGFAATRSPVRVPPSTTDTDGAIMLTVARTYGLEGIVAKRIRSTYQPGRRSPDWVKTKCATLSASAGN
jgi:bifunctional non-homologous end joining protein LigD